MRVKQVAILTTSYTPGTVQGRVLSNLPPLLHTQEFCEVFKLVTYWFHDPQTTAVYLP